jgi:DNA invertase Pin-like site-specific DNA recombinase
MMSETATLKRQRDELRDAIVKYKWVVENASDGTGGAMNMISVRRELEKVLDSLGSGE